MAWNIPISWHNPDAKYVGRNMHMIVAIVVINFFMINMAVSVYIHTTKKSTSCHIKYNWIFMKKILIFIFGGVLGANMSKFNILS